MRLHFRTFCFVVSKFSSRLLLKEYVLKECHSLFPVSVSIFSCSVFCSTGSEISHFWFIRTQEKINVKNFFAILTVCITTDCKCNQANEKILSYKLQGQPQKMGCSQIPIKKYAHTYFKCNTAISDFLSIKDTKLSAKKELTVF